MQVRSSPAASKRSFLEKKGLTAAEIDEAFRRVPDTPTASVPAGPSGLPVQAATEAPRKPFPTGTAATLQQLQPQPIVQQAPTPQPIRWTQVAAWAVLGVGSSNRHWNCRLWSMSFTSGVPSCFRGGIAKGAWATLGYVAGGRKMVFSCFSFVT